MKTRPPIALTSAAVAEAPDEPHDAMSPAPTRVTAAGGGVGGLAVGAGGTLVGAGGLAVGAAGAFVDADGTLADADRLAAEADGLPADTVGLALTVSEVPAVGWAGLVEGVSLGFATHPATRARMTNVTSWRMCRDLVAGR